MKIYITHQLARTLDFRDNQSTDGVGATHEWVYQNDGSHVVVEWPFHLDVSYSTINCIHTFTRWFSSRKFECIPDKKAEWDLLSTDSDKSNIAPSKFSLSQNYPNPFNPSTEIAYSLEQASNITLTIFNVIGQQIRVLENSSKLAGTHTANGMVKMNLVLQFQQDYTFTHFLMELHLYKKDGINEVI